MREIRQGKGYYGIISQLFDVFLGEVAYFLGGSGLLNLTFPPAAIVSGLGDDGDSIPATQSQLESVKRKMGKPTGEDDPSKRKGMRAKRFKRECELTAAGTDRLARLRG